LGAEGASGAGAAAAGAAALRLLAGSATGAWFVLVTDALAPGAGASPEDLWCLPREPPSVPLPRVPRPPPARLRISDPLPAESCPSVCVAPSLAATASSPRSVGPRCVEPPPRAPPRCEAGPPRRVLTRMRSSRGEGTAGWEEPLSGRRRRSVRPAVESRPVAAGTSAGTPAAVGVSVPAGRLGSERPGVAGLART
jgi:hypothetical protein